MGRPPKNRQPPPALAPITPGNSTSSQVVKALTDYIFSGQVAPGEKLPSERQLAESFQVTRSAVRDAIQSLGMLGLVDIRQGDGTYLRDEGVTMLPAAIEWGLFLGERRVMDLVEARQPIEIALAGFAAKRRTEEQLAKIEEAVEAVRDPDVSPEAFVDADVRFHFAIAEAAGNTALSGVLSGIHTLLRAWMSKSIAAAGETRTSFGEHVAILEAIRRQDTRTAQAAMRTHMRNAERRLRRGLASEVAPDERSDQ